MNALFLTSVMAVSCAGLLLSSGSRADAAFFYAPDAGECANRADPIYLADEAGGTCGAAVAGNETGMRVTRLDVHAAVMRTDSELEGAYCPFILRESPGRSNLLAAGESHPFVRGNERCCAGPGNRARVARPRPGGPRIGARRMLEVSPCPERCHYRLIERGRKGAIPVVGMCLPGTTRPKSRFTTDGVAASRGRYRSPRPRRSFVEFRITSKPEESR